MCAYARTSSVAYIGNVASAASMTPCRRLLRASPRRTSTKHSDTDTSSSSQFRSIGVLLTAFRSKRSKPQTVMIVPVYYAGSVIGFFVSQVGSSSILEFPVQTSVSQATPRCRTASSCATLVTMDPWLTTRLSTRQCVHVDL
ncbi:hypothetical protein BD310DRAFT_1026612, partial [Dichomitus squalens]